jgi:hypothetical protein
VSGVVVSVATAWSAVEDFVGRRATCWKTASKGHNYLPLPHSSKFFHVLEETKETHAQNNGRETLMNWHPCFISVTHLAASALGLKDEFFSLLVTFSIAFY